MRASTLTCLVLFLIRTPPPFFFFFFFNDTATTEIYTLSLHDALPICLADQFLPGTFDPPAFALRLSHKDVSLAVGLGREDRKSTRLNSSHQIISYAVFCLKKKKRKTYNIQTTRYTLYIRNIYVTRSRI